MVGMKLFSESERKGDYDDDPQQCLCVCSCLFSFPYIKFTTTRATLPSSFPTHNAHFLHSLPFDFTTAKHVRKTQPPCFRRPVGFRPHG